MTNVKVLAARAAISLVAVGSLAGGLYVVGMAPAGAATPSKQATAHTAAVRQRACQRVRRAESTAVRNEARWASRTARFEALAVKAQKNGNAELTKYWQSVVTRRDTTATKMKTRLAAREKKASQDRSANHRTC